MAALVAVPALILASPASAAPGHVKGGPGNGYDPGDGRGHEGHLPSSINVTTKFFLSQQDISEGSLGGETKLFTVTLEPSNLTAAYEDGTFTIGCATVGYNNILLWDQESITETVSTTTPGDLVLPNIEFGFSHSLPTCGDDPFGGPFTIFLQYSGGAYVHNGTTYDLQPDTWGPVAVVPEGPNELSNTQQP